jgi:transposase
VNVLKPHLRITIETLLQRGVSHREIARRTGVDRKTIAAEDRGQLGPEDLQRHFPVVPDLVEPGSR